MYLIKWIQTLYFEIDEDEYQSVLSQKISQSGFERELINTVNSSLFNFEKRVMNKDKSEKLLNDLGIRIKQSHLRVQRENLKQKQRDCRSSEEETKLMTEIQSIQQQLNELKI